MDVTLLSRESLKIKIKKTTFVLNPQEGMVKADADAILAFGQINSGRVNNFRVIINGVGEYEVSGTKVSAVKLGNGLLFYFSLQGAEMALVKASSISSLEKDKIKSYDIVIMDADEKINQSAITAMEPRVIILFGENAKETATQLGKESLPSSSKVNISEEKLPEEAEVYLLN